MKSMTGWSVVVESDRFAVIRVDAGKCDDRASRVAADIFGDGICIGEVRLCIWQMMIAKNKAKED